MTRQIFLDPGHSFSDPGATHMGFGEAERAIELSKHLLPLLGEFGTVRLVPNTYNLKQTIEFINASAKPGDVAIATHFNSHANFNVRGTEVYYHNTREKAIAKVLSRTIATKLGIPNRGARPDRWTWLGRLGFLRNLKIDSVLCEMMYITNDHDRNIYTPERAAAGIVDGFREIFPSSFPSLSLPNGLPKLDNRTKLEAELTGKQIEALLNFIWNFSKDIKVVERVRKALSK